MLLKAFLGLFFVCHWPLLSVVVRSDPMSCPPSVCANLVGGAGLAAPASTLFIDDIDNDGVVEVVVGTRDERLLVFRTSSVASTGGAQLMLSATVVDAGLITALTCGNVFNIPGRSSSVLCSLGMDGAFAAYSVFHNTAREQRHTNQFGDYYLERQFGQLLNSGIRYALIADIDRDGYQELMVALTDRIVRSYRFLAEDDSSPMVGRLVPLNKWELPAQITALALADPRPPGFEAGVDEIDDNSPLITPPLLVILSQPINSYVRLNLAGDHLTSSDNVEFICDAQRSATTDAEGALLAGISELFLTPDVAHVGLFHSNFTGVSVTSGYSDKPSYRLSGLSVESEVCFVSCTNANNVSLVTVVDYDNQVAIYRLEKHQPTEVFDEPLCRVDLANCSAMLTYFRTTCCRTTFFLTAVTIYHDLLVYSVPLTKLLPEKKV